MNRPGESLLYQGGPVCAGTSKTGSKRPRASCLPGSVGSCWRGLWSLSGGELLEPASATTPTARRLAASRARATSSSFSWPGEFSRLNEDHGSDLGSSLTWGCTCPMPARRREGPHTKPTGTEGHDEQRACYYPVAFQARRPQSSRSPAVHVYGLCCFTQWFHFTQWQGRLSSRLALAEPLQVDSEARA